jgi:GNAT superfamily N-acetyltransferase
MAQQTDLRLEVTAAPSSEDLKVIGEGLSTYNDESVGPANRIPLAVLLRAFKGEVRGGLSGYTAWGWLYVQWLWLADELRARGFAAKLLAAAETEAMARGCHGAYIDTFNPTALRLYERLGYKPFGRLEAFPRGHTRTFLAKQLKQQAEISGQ